MPKITYQRPDGSSVTHDVPVGVSVMRGAVINGVDGIVAECGGAASCGTCHVYVAESFNELLPARHELEEDVLLTVAGPHRGTSRLSCQLPVTAELDGLVVELPDRQGRADEAEPG